MIGQPRERERDGERDARRALSLFSLFLLSLSECLFLLSGPVFPSRSHSSLLSFPKVPKKWDVIEFEALSLGIFHAFARCLARIALAARRRARSSEVHTRQHIASLCSSCFCVSGAHKLLADSPTVPRLRRRGANDHRPECEVPFNSASVNIAKARYRQRSYLASSKDF